ncbi:MAG: TetR/AcrR family transcriptional regulator [Proteobacteria bacterium]|nr:TetR/AcrR family transcriptional regulator [Pseudomonadota bacterium]
MQAAIDVIADQGFHEARLDEVAARAGVSTPAIYKHFKNKEDILFATTRVKLLQFEAENEQALLGIEGPLNIIRKLIWTYLDMWRRNPKEALIILMECRSNKRFYQTEAYQVVKNLNRRFVGLIEEGQRTGVFDPQLHTPILRDLTFGALDHMALRALLADDVPSTDRDFEDIFSLFVQMTRPPSQGGPAGRDKRAMLLDAALQVFGRKGYRGATIAEIAQSAGVSDGIVYEYFTNKEDLLLSVANRKIHNDVSTLQEMFHITDPRRKLRRFIRYHCSLYLADRNYLILFLLLIQTHRRFYTRMREGSIQAYNQFIQDIVVEGQERGVFRPDINPGAFRSMIMGGINHIFLRWFIVHEDDSSDKLEEIDIVTDLLTRAISV